MWHRIAAFLVRTLPGRSAGALTHRGTPGVGRSVRSTGSSRKTRKRPSMSVERGVSGETVLSPGLEGRTPVVETDSGVRRGTFGAAREKVEGLAKGREPVRGRWASGVRGLRTSHRQYKRSLRLPERPLRLPEPPLRSAEPRLRFPEASLRFPEPSLHFPETPLRSAEPPLRSSEPLLRRSESPLRLSKSALRFSESPLRPSESPLRLSESALRPIFHRRRA